MMRAPLTGDCFQWLVDLRRRLHRCPELMYKEEKTAAIIREVLDGLGVPYAQGVGKTGIVATAGKDDAPRVVAFRADMDALPLSEENDVPYKSEHPGRMHACGHDGHMAIALGIIRRLVETGWRDQADGRILFIFQPAEEGGAGAKAMLDSGFFDGIPVRAVFAGHMYPEFPAGRIAVAPGPCNAAADRFSIRLTGRGGHAAHPHQCKDVILMGSHLVVQLQGLVSRELSALDSAVLSIGTFQSGTASNIISETACITGTLRTLDRDIRARLLGRMQDLLNGLEAAHHIRTAFKVDQGYPALRNHPDMAKHMIRCGGEVLGPDNVHEDKPRMGAEDFSYFCEQWPGVMTGLGCRAPGTDFKHGLHSSRFDMDEAVLGVGVRLFSHALTSCIESISGSGGKEAAC